MRRRKHRTKSRRRMSGLGAIGTGGFNTEIGVVLGAGVGGFVNKLFAGNTTITPKVLGASKVVLGGIISKMSTNPLIKGTGLGMVGVGGYELLGSFGLFAGLGQTDEEMLAVSLDGIGADVLGTNYEDISTINGTGDVDVVNGIGADVLGTDETDEYIM